MELRALFKEAAKSPATAQMVVGGVAVSLGVATGNAWYAIGAYALGEVARPYISGYIARRLS